MNGIMPLADVIVMKTRLTKDGSNAAVGTKPKAIGLIRTG